MSNPNREVFEYRGQCIAECYNQFFNPNICHVCKSVDRGKLILCSQCYLISYCSEEHKMIHHPYHAKICAIIAQVLQVKPHQDMRTFYDWQQWIQSRKILMESIQERLDDKMEPYMEQMILWSKSCVVCYQQANLRVCQRCFSANYCNQHAEVFNRKHDGAKCDQLMLLLNIDIKTISGKTSNISYNFFLFINKRSCFEEMLEFCIEYILMRRKDLDWLAKDYVRSDYLSEPLTVYSGLKRTHLLRILQSSLVIIHIIAVNPMKGDSLPAWEILLHLVPQIQQLLIILVGPKLMNYDTGKCKLCKRCMDSEKMFFYVSIPMLYCDFIRSDKYIIPTVIAGFHIELDKGNICTESIQEIMNQRCILFLCSSSKREVKKNIIKIEEVLDRIVEPDFNERNHFSGLAPHKDLETGDIYFHNEYLTIYNNSYYDSSAKFSSYT
ncbi:uncharacterized protein LOC116846785 [Odontomachus brunneus]|uniref:uncharacterized protein LOC116846785 n=1 Tax=Odontomachus brunneus TaxID=486640 RepID=UPI0013F1F6B3|nr:uncharacterized protein LOC116846785 [Odontomachus brunneus]